MNKQIYNYNLLIIFNKNNYKLLSFRMKKKYYHKEAIIKFKAIKRNKYKNNKLQTKLKIKKKLE
jgi:hypothetical protein